MAIITSPGVGSGLDVTSIVSQLVKAEGEVPAIRLDKREAGLQVKLSGYAFIKSSVSALKLALGVLNQQPLYNGRLSTTSDSDITTATTTGEAIPGNFDVTVTALADANTLSTDPALAAAKFTSTTDVIGTGSLTFKFGTTTYDKGSDSYTGFVQNSDRASATINITDGSLAGIRDAINDADIGVSASIINDGNYYRLVVASDTTGAENGIQITTVDDDLDDGDASGLSLLSFNASSNNSEQTVAGIDAQLTINGIAISSASNTVTGSIENVTLNVKALGSSTITVSRDDNKISSAVQSFVSAYNEFQDTVTNLSGFNASTQVAGTLNGDSLVRSIDSNVKRLLGAPVGDVVGGFSILADIGVTTDADTGKLVIDQSKLDASISSSPEKITALFSAFGENTDTQVIFDSSTGSTVEGNYAVNITQLATQGGLTAAVAANLTITAAVNDSIDVNIDGIITTVKLTAGAYTASSLASEVQSQINNTDAIKNAGVTVKVTENSGVISITSNRYGSASKVDITSGNGLIDLVGIGATTTDGVDVAGTIGGNVATGNGQYLTGTASGATGLKLLITGNTTGSRGTVDFKRGIADRIDTYLGQILDDKGIISTTTATVEGNIEDVASDRDSLNIRLASLEDRLRRRYIALDTLISTLQNTSAFLVEQLQSLPTIGSRNK